MRQPANLGAELDGVLPSDLGYVGRHRVTVIAVHDRAAGATGAKHAVVAGDYRNRLHAERDLIIEGGGPPKLRQVVSQRCRRAVIAETQVSDTEIADQRWAEG